MLRLCQAETSASKALDWIKKLADLHEAHPNVRDKLEEREVVSLASFAHIVGFILVLEESQEILLIYL